MAAKRVIQSKLGIEPDLLFKVTIPRRFHDGVSIDQIRDTARAWEGWLATDEAEGLWYGTWIGVHEDYIMSFTHLPTATAFKLKFC